MSNTRFYIINKMFHLGAIFFSVSGSLDSFKSSYNLFQKISYVHFLFDLLPLFRMLFYFFQLLFSLFVEFFYFISRFSSSLSFSGKLWAVSRFYFYLFEFDVLLIGLELGFFIKKKKGSVSITHTYCGNFILCLPKRTFFSITIKVNFFQFLRLKLVGCHFQNLQNQLQLSDKNCYFV